MMNRRVPIRLTITLCVVLLSGLASDAVHSHDWYPVECCHGEDCAPVTSYSYMVVPAYDATGKAIANTLPRLVVTTRIGTAIVPNDLPRQPSKDNQMHVCMRSDVYGIGVYVKCIFVPPTD